jgi:hypothetical protein
MKEPAPDITGLKITKCPPGRAIGADYFRNWSFRRSGGRSGSGAKPASAIAARGASDLKPAKGDAR